jgi:hypothetical protein
MPRTDASKHTMMLTAAADDAGNDVFAISYQPTAARHNIENLELEATWPYGIISDTAPDFALEQRSYQNRLAINNPDWTPDAIQAARLGLAKRRRTSSPR